MCGIAGCVGHEQAPEFVVGALEALEYRGYDSAGIAFETECGIDIVRAIGRPENVRRQLAEVPHQGSSDTAIGHTRWATHGKVTLQNTHPHTNTAGTIASVCNGNIENYAALKSELIDNGYEFSSQTDTEVVPHLFDYYLREGAEPDEAFINTMRRLAGAYAIVALCAELPGTVYAAKVGSPLVVGVNSHEHFAASDPAVFVDHTDKQAVYLEDYDAAKLSRDGWGIISSRNAASAIRQPEDIDSIYQRTEKGDFADFMLKEIYDSPETVRSATRGRVRPNENIIKLGGLESVEGRLKDIERIIIVACGTSYYAGLIGESLIEEIAGIPVEVEFASEFNYRTQPLKKHTAVLAISQSGETADTIAALKKAEAHGLLRLGVVNTPGSTISRMTEAGVYCQAGPEISVASTKAFTSQVTVLTEIAMSLAKESSKLNHQLMEELTNLPEKIEAILADTSSIEAAAKKYAHYTNFLFIGRGYNYPNALEGALKLKEISYIHAEGYGAGEMKHGPLAMIDEDFPTLAIATNSHQLPKTMSNIEEIRTREGPVLALATEGNEAIARVASDVLYVPDSLEQTQPILNGVVLQLFAYYIAVEKGLDIDHPRNLAKSVTVE